MSKEYDNSKEELYKIIFEVDEDEFQRRLEEWFKQ